MNLRILKKLSKRAAPLLHQLGDAREQFRAERGESYQSLGGHDRKHWERTRVRNPLRRRGNFTYRPKDGKNWILMREPSHPLKGTVMVGERAGYYEPEWEEETAWEALHRALANHFTEWTEDGPTWVGPRLSSPTQVFTAAERVVADHGGVIR